MSAFILAGGESKRFGRDKSLYIYKNKPLIEHVFDVLKTIFIDISIISNDYDRYSYLRLPSFPDNINGKGPLIGIHSALCHSKTSNAFIVACDMPNIDSKFIKYLISISMGFDVIIPYINNNYEPLHAIYSRDCIVHIKKQIEDGERKISSFFDKVTVKKINKEVIDQYADCTHVFKNINFLKDLE